MTYPPLNYRAAKVKYPNNPFEGICKELLDLIELKNISLKLYDYILVDEAQDFPSSFFKLAYQTFKNEDKRNLSFAYDELQTLSNSHMPTGEEMFGQDSQGRALVNFDNKENCPRVDIVLPICYRNTQWALTVAHALGFGIYRQAEPGEKTNLVQFFDDLTIWKDIGYKVLGDTKLDYNKDVTLMRSEDATPQYFNSLLDSKDALLYRKFDSCDNEYLEVAKSIQKDINEQELDPDDILVIFANRQQSYEKYSLLENYLTALNISSVMPGINIDRDTFTSKNSVTCTHIYRAKGNEKPMVYLLDAEYGIEDADKITGRNMLFTAITRSRAWVRIFGVGSNMQQLICEINKCVVQNNYKLSMHIPEKDDIANLNVVNKKLTGQERRQRKEFEKALHIVVNQYHDNKSAQSEALLKSILKQNNRDK